MPKAACCKPVPGVLHNWLLNEERKGIFLVRVEMGLCSFGVSEESESVFEWRRISVRGKCPKVTSENVVFRTIFR